MLYYAQLRKKLCPGRNICSRYFQKLVDFSLGISCWTRRIRNKYQVFLKYFVSLTLQLKIFLHFKKCVIWKVHVFLGMPLWLGWKSDRYQQLCNLPEAKYKNDLMKTLHGFGTMLEHWQVRLVSQQYFGWCISQYLWIHTLCKVKSSRIELIKQNPLVFG